jgi:hypothetical protein
MLQLASTQRQLIPLEFDIMVTVCEMDAAGKKETIFFSLRSAINEEYRKYAKARKFKSAGLLFTHERCITFKFDYPKPAFGEIMTYALQFGPNGVIVSPVTPYNDPEIAPFLEPVNLSEMKNEFFNLADFEPRKHKPTNAPIVPVDQTCSKQSA